MYIPKADFGYGKSDGRRVPEKKIVVFTGAGISAPSGISTFRDANGLWENHKIEEICNENTWRDNFEAVHKFYNERRMQLSTVKQNVSHEAIVKLIEKYGANNIYNITQNVDDLFERAGGDVLHVHGELTKMECEGCNHVWEIGYNAFDVHKDVCPNCKKVEDVRPKIVFFYGQAPMYTYMMRAFDYTMNPDTIVVVIGTMGNVVDVNNMLVGTPCKKILCNMEPSRDLPTGMFDKVYFESCETAIHNIVSDIDKYWNENS